MEITLQTNIFRAFKKWAPGYNFFFQSIFLFSNRVWTYCGNLQFFSWYADTRHHASSEQFQVTSVILLVNNQPNNKMIHFVVGLPDVCIFVVQLPQFVFYFKSFLSKVLAKCAVLSDQLILTQNRHFIGLRKV